MTTMYAPSIATGTLKERALLVNLSQSCWGAKRLDRAATEETLERNGAEKDAGKFEKLLAPKHLLDPITKRQAAARARHRKMTLAWGDDGDRLLSSAMFFDYTEAMREEDSAITVLVQHFIRVEYPIIRHSAPARLGPKLYKVSDFPEPSVLAEKFGFRLSLLPVADHEDFRVSLGEDVEARVRADAEAKVRAKIESTVSDRTSEAQREVWERLLKTATHFAHTMANPDKKFHDSTITNLQEIARLAPKLSIVTDDTLAELCQEVLTLTANLDRQTLVDSKALRGSVAVKAKRTLADIEAAMQGF